MALGSEAACYLNSSTFRSAATAKKDTRRPTDDTIADDAEPVGREQDLAQRITLKKPRVIASDGERLRASSVDKLDSLLVSRCTENSRFVQVASEVSSIVSICALCTPATFLLSLFPPQLPSEPVTLLVQLSSTGPFEVIETTGALIGHVKDDIIAKFKKRFAGLDPDELQLFKLEGRSMFKLDPAQTLHDAGVRSGTKLVASVRALSSAAGAFFGLSLPVRFIDDVELHYSPAVFHTGIESQAPLPWLIGRAEGITLADPTIIRRNEKCAAIFSALELQSVRLLRSPPGSGKTSLAALLVANAPAGRVVTAISALCATSVPFEDTWVKSTGMSMEEALDPGAGTQRTFIIDEAQTLYPLGADSPFWKLTKYINGVPASRVQILLLAVYGLRARTDQLATPIEISGDWSLSFLALSDAETDEFFAAFNTTCTVHSCPPIPIAIRTAMKHLCGHHVGLLRRCELLFQDYFKGKSVLTTVDEGDFNAGPLVHLGSAGELRALPSLLDLSSTEVDVIMRVASSGPEGLTLTRLEVSTFPAGLIVAGVVDLETHYAGLVARFSSPAMRAHALRTVFGNRPRLPLSSVALASASSLVRAVVVRMMQSELRDSLSKASRGSLLERQYQMSFYS